MLIQSAYEFKKKTTQMSMGDSMKRYHQKQMNTQLSRKIAVINQIYGR